MNRKQFFLSGTDTGMTAVMVTRLGSIRGLIAAALLLTLLFTGCVSTQIADEMLFPPDKKGSVRTIGVVSGGDPQLAMHAYEKDQKDEAASRILGGAEQGLMLGIDPLTVLLLPITVPLGAVIGGVSAAAEAVPTKRA